MKCLSPLKIVNPKYKGEKGLEPETIYDYYLIVPCGRCFECLKSRASNWKSRLYVEYQHSKRSVFLTLTIDNEHLEFCQSNTSSSIRRFLELYRRYFGHSVRHFFITELGSEKGRLHFHGILFDYDCELQWIHDHWTYGQVWIGWCNARTIGYIVKYITKPQSDISPDWYYPKTYCSPGLGKQFLQNPNVVEYHQKSFNQLVHVGTCMYTMPRYYRDKIFDKKLMQKHYYEQLRLDFEDGFFRSKNGKIFHDQQSYNDYNGLMRFTYDRIGGMSKTQVNPHKRVKSDSNAIFKTFNINNFLNETSETSCEEAEVQ